MPAPVQEQKRLLTLYEPVGECTLQPIRQDPGWRTLLLPQIYDLHLRQWMRGGSIGKHERHPFSPMAEFPAFERWRGGSENAECAGHPGPDHGDRSGVISRSLALLVAPIVFFVHDDYAEVGYRR
jgi:hypothetical protein